MTKAKLCPGVQVGFFYVQSSECFLLFFPLDNDIVENNSDGKEEGK